jgi:hypothetical protein
MLRMCLVGLLVVAPADLLAQKAQVKFADIPWGANANTVRQLMSASGYKFIEIVPLTPSTKRAGTGFTPVKIPSWSAGSSDRG